MTGTGAAVGPGLGHPDYSAHTGGNTGGNMGGSMGGMGVTGVPGGMTKEKKFLPKEGKESAIREGTWARKVMPHPLFIINTTTVQHTLLTCA